MTAHPSKPFVRDDLWREGEWIDLWSVVHFLSGMSVGLGFYFLRFDARASVLLALLSFTSYEMWEAWMKIEETPANRFMDVVVGMASFLPTFFWIAPALTPGTSFVLTFVVICILNIGLAALGWRASQKAAELEKRVRARYAKQRTQLVKKEKQLLKKLTQPK